MHLVNQTNVQGVLELSARRREGYLVVLSTCPTKRWNGYDKRAILEYLCVVRSTSERLQQMISQVQVSVRTCSTT